MRLEIESGVVELLAPFGVVNATFDAHGTLGEDFAALVRIANTSVATGAYALTDAGAELRLTSQAGAIDARLFASAGALSWADASAERMVVRATAHTPLDLSRLEFAGDWRAAVVRRQTMAARAPRLGGVLRSSLRADALAFADWQANLQGEAESLQVSGASVESAVLQARAASEGAHGRGDWSFAASSFEKSGLRSRAPSAAGEFALGAAGSSGRARLALARARLTAAAQRNLRAMLPEIRGAPVAAPFGQARRALERAGADFEVTIPIAHTSDDSGSQVWLSEPAVLNAASGAGVRMQALRSDAPALTLRFPGATLQGAFELTLSGGGAPNATLLLDTFSSSPEAPFEADGTLTLANWRAERASIAADELGVSISLQPPAAGRIDLAGPISASGPLGAGEIRGITAALDLALRWDANGWRATSNGGCQAVRAASIDVAGLAFTNGALALCPLDGALLATDARGNLSGGFSVQRLALAGRMAGAAAQPARLHAANVIGRFRGRAGAATLALEAQTPALAIQLADTRTLSVSLRRLTADARLARDWSVEGAFEQGLLIDPNLPGAVSAIEGRWRAAPEDGTPIIRVEAGEAVLTANRPATDAERPLFNPLRMVETTGELRAGDINAEGAIVLVEGERPLARFTAHHDIGEGVGQAQVVVRDLQFGPTLQPYEITERLRGLVENVRGPASVAADVNWSNARIAAQGHVRLDGLSLATSTIPIVENVRGDVFFDDLFALTTPPGQAATVGLVNPGVAVSNGRVRFQLLTEQRVSIEEAEFDFASGTLAMAPTTITLGADETRFALTLRDVDAAGLLATLNIPDLAVTGRIEGEFPLLLSRRSALIQNGVLRAQDGGTIAYTGNAGAGATGAAAIAFDALKSFHYDELELTLDGDLSGEVVSSIAFSGENSGRPVDLGPIAPIPGVGSVTVRGVPFDFNVRVTAPFRRLAQTVASITDPGVILENAEEEEQPETVDPAPSPPR